MTEFRFSIPAEVFFSIQATSYQLARTAATKQLEENVLGLDIDLAGKDLQASRVYLSENIEDLQLEDSVEVKWEQPPPKPEPKTEWQQGVYTSDGWPKQAPTPRRHYSEYDTPLMQERRRRVLHLLASGVMACQEICRDADIPLGSFSGVIRHHWFQKNPEGVGFMLTEAGRQALPVLA